MSKGFTMDIEFDYYSDFCIGSHHATCNACGRRYRHHNREVVFGGFRGEEKYGPEYEEGVFYGHGLLCGDCILSSPHELAAKFRVRADKIRRRDREKAEGMIELAAELEKVRDLRDLDGGIMAAKIAEGYRELDGPRGGRKGAAA